MKKLFSSTLILCILFAQVSPILSVDELYNLSSYYSPQLVTVEKERKFCFYALRTKSEDIGDLQYLSRGIPSIILTEVRKLGYVYDENLVYDVVRHTMGNPKDPSNTKEKQGLDNNLSNKRVLDGGGLNASLQRKLEYKQEELDAILSNKKKELPSKDPRYIPLTVEYERDKALAIESEDVYRYGHKKNCSYGLTGEFSKTSSGSIVVNLELTNLLNGKVTKYTHSTSIERSLQEMLPLADKIKKTLIQKQLAYISIQTNPISGALVFVDGNYIGKTPLEKTSLPFGRHEILITHKDYQEYKSELELLPEQSKSISVDLISNQRSAFISVSSEPSGADVYLGVEKIGQTPLAKVSVPAGKNRLRIAKEEFIDHYQGIDLAIAETGKFKVTLKPGKSEAYYLNKDYVFLDYTHKDFMVYSVWGALLFYAGNIYFQLQANKLRDSLRPEIQINSLAQAQALFSQNNNLAVATILYEEIRIREVKSQIRDYNRIAGNIGFGRTRSQARGGLMLYGAAFMVATGLTFYFLGLDQETLDIGFDPGIGTVTPNQYSEAKGHIHYNFRF